jgi:hypothetical protein
MAPHLDCNSDEAHVPRAIAAASLVIWGLGIPLALFAMMHRFRDDPKYSFIIISYGYKPTLRWWEAWECLKKFLILLIITFLRATPELAAVILLAFLCFTITLTAECHPFTSSLINRAHTACEFLNFFVLLTGLLSTSARGTGPKEAETKEVETLSILVVSYAACLLAGLAFILWIELGKEGGARQTMWNRFVTSSHDAAVRLSHIGQSGAAQTFRRLSADFRSFSPIVVPVSDEFPSDAPPRYGPHEADSVEAIGASIN